MDQKEKKTLVENREKRKNARLDESRPISVKEQKAGIIHRAKMLNYSKTGMYFETDSILQTGARIYLGIKNPPGTSFADEFECNLAEIVWREKLKKSFYNYGYGVKFISTANPQEKEPANKKEAVDSRKHPRQLYSTPVLYAADNQILKGTSQNISLSGIFVKTEDKLRVGQTIILSLPAKTKNRVKIKGEVIWSSDEGCGVKFLKKLKQ